MAEQILTHLYRSPLGEITINSDGENITGLYFSDSLTVSYGHIIAESLPIFAQAREWLDIYFSGKGPGFFPPLKIEGSEIQKAVCEVMMTIPFGHTMTYSQVAEHSGLPRMSARTAGGAASRNRISLMIPCHRVIGKNGSLTGYGGGIWRKKKLLELEGVDTSKFFVPSTI